MILVLFIFLGIYNLSSLHTSLVGFLGGKAYERGDFGEARKSYETLLDGFSGSSLLKADIFYNLGNTYYQQGEQAQNTERIRLWQQSIANYTKSLTLRIDTDTEENLAFVREKLQKEEVKKEETKKEETKKEKQEPSEKDQQTSEKGDEKAPHSPPGDKPTDTGDKKPNQSSGTTSNDANQQDPRTEKESKTSDTKGPDGSQKTDQKKQNWSNDGAYNSIGGTGSLNTKSGLSDSDRTDIAQYLEGLKQFEKQNGKLLNPDKPNGVGNISDQIRNLLGNDSFFQDAFPDNNQKKDW